MRGPFDGDNELPAGFSILRARSLEEATDWATRQAAALGDVEIDIRPVTEPWDIGAGAEPADVDTRRYMVLRKATAGTETGDAPSAAQRTELTSIDRRDHTERHAPRRRNIAAQPEGPPLQELPRRRHLL